MTSQAPAQSVSTETLSLRRRRTTLTSSSGSLSVRERCRSPCPQVAERPCPGDAASLCLRNFVTPRSLMFEWLYTDWNFRYIQTFISGHSRRSGFQTSLQQPCKLILFLTHSEKSICDLCWFREHNIVSTLLHNSNYSPFHCSWVVETEEMWFKALPTEQNCLYMSRYSNLYFITVSL